MAKKLVDQEGKIKCNRCSKMLPDNYNLKTCPTCRAKRSKLAKQETQRRKENNLCMRCGVELPQNYEHATCEKCLSEVIELSLKRKEKLIAEHRCEDCGVKLKKNDHHRKCVTCRIKNNELSAITRKRNANNVQDDVEHLKKVKHYDPEKVREYLKSLLQEGGPDSFPGYILKRSKKIYYYLYNRSVGSGFTIEEYIEEFIKGNV